MNNELMHYGVPGMRWGIRRSEYRAMSRADRKLHKKQFKADVKGHGKHSKYGEFVVDFDDNMIPTHGHINGRKVNIEYARAVADRIATKTNNKNAWKSVGALASISVGSVAVGKILSNITKK